jgi:hypothetical protein
MWGFSAPRDAFAMPADFEALGAEDLKARVMALTTGWAPRFGTWWRPRSRRP